MQNTVAPVPTPQRILVIRNDKLGDFMLAYPSFALLKTALPAAQITALVPAYTAPMAEACPWIDNVLIDRKHTAKLTDLSALTKSIRSQHFDAVITLYSTSRVAIACWLAAIPYRLAPATKVAQLFYNHRLKQRRSRSEKPEYEYNLDLIRTFLNDHAIACPALPAPPYLTFPTQQIDQLRQAFIQQHGLTAEQQLVFIHPGSGGSARNLSLPQYAALLQQLESPQGHCIVISCGPGEEQAAQQLAELLHDLPHVIFSSQQGLLDFAMHLQLCAVFISGSTGPLHIAAALNRPTVGFYPRRRSATSLRWQTTNSEDRRLSFMPAENFAEEDMQGIDITAAARSISEKFLR